MAMNLIYALTEPDTGEVRYVGQTTMGLKRVRQHISGLTAKDGCKYKARWVKSIRARGQKPGAVILTTLPDSELLDKAERYWIALFRSEGHRLTNLTDGGGRRYRLTAESKAKIGATHRGKAKTFEHKAKLSLANTGHTPSEETRNKLRDARLGHKYSPETCAKIGCANRGKKFSIEYREKLSIAHGGKSFVDQYGNIYRTLGEAEQRTGAHQSNIRSVLRGFRKLANGFMFTYLENKQ